MTIAGLTLALAVGVSLGLLGGGGSVLTVPIFVYVMGFEAKQSIAMSLVVVGTVSLIGAIGHWRAGRVDTRLAVVFGVIAIAASYVGARLSSWLSGTAQLAMLAIVICVAATFMFRNAAGPRTAAAVVRTTSIPRLAPIALGVGALTGLVGVGGGFLIVPALVLVGGVPIQLAIGTSLVVIAMNCAASFAGYAGTVVVPWATVVAFTAIASVGTLVGARLCGLVSPTSLKRGFAVLLIFVGGFMLFKSRHPLAAAQSSGGPHTQTVEVSVVPPDSTLTDPSARRGAAILAHTGDSLPANRLNALRCLSCHLGDGRRANSAPLVGTFARYPRYIERSGRVATMEDRVNFCLTRSMAGDPLPDSSVAMHDMVAYLRWLSTNVPTGAHVTGESMPKMAKLTGDTTRGATLFAATCVRCHGGDGQGTVVAPPLWGARAYSIGASMAREERAASFIRYNMPFDRPGTLTDQQAFDLAAFVNAHAHPDLPGKANDWPKGGAPYDVPYATAGHAAYREPSVIAR